MGTGIPVAANNTLGIKTSTGWCTNCSGILQVDEQ
jgi:hypothetical protein